MDTVPGHGEFKKRWTPTTTAFQRLLAWLDEGVDSRGEKYEEMRRRLVAYFERKRCASPYDLADDTLNRVTRRLEETGTIADPAPPRYCYIVARYVFLEYLRSPEHKQATLAPDMAAGSPLLDQWSERRQDCLLTRGLIRVGLDVPSGAEFAIDSVSDPNRCLPATNDASLYRRPLPSTNLKFLTAVMWDGRESSATTTLLQDLGKQANDATRGHAAAAQDLTPAQARQIVNFEMGLFTAQAQDRAAGNLSAHGANGGPVAVANNRSSSGSTTRSA